jgi:type 1 glutamine amidotransferase
MMFRFGCLILTLVLLPGAFIGSTEKVQTAKARLEPPLKKKLLAIGDAQTYGYQHDAVSHALAVIERLGRESGVYDTWIRTDAQLLTKQEVKLQYGKVRNIRNLNDFDAVFFYTAGNPAMSDQQKSDFLSFIRQDGKGFVGAHSATTTFYSWPEFGEMIGGYFDDHPWDVFNAPVIVEAPDFPAMKVFPRRFVIRDEIYQLKAPYARDKVRVLARLDAGKLDLKNPRVHRTDKDFPVAWAAQYGKGRVFYSSLGHTVESWDRPDVQKMWLEAIKWAMGLTDADVTPRPMLGARQLAPAASRQQ